jgi:hypothetical protein
MVNLNTGGLSYVLPLLNVPSPEGGYPVSLSYHAGIAMEQEASWVGLGWSLNPGSINRGVNGYPDDWGETNVKEFFYDKGYVEEFFSISAGATIGNTVSVGLGLSWGTGQSLGGYVSANIGFGPNGENGSIGIQIGANGVGLNGSVGGFSVSASTNGIGIGYSGSKSGSANLGVRLNYSPNSGLSGGVSINPRGEATTLEDGSTVKGTKLGSMGVNFSSNGISPSAMGAGVSTSSQSLSVNDYDITRRSTGFSLPLGVFYIGFNYTKIKRSLYKFNDLYVSGIVYPYYANQARFPEEIFPTILDPNHFMDVNTISKFDASNFLDNLLDVTDQLEENNLELPNYDNYTLTAQGLSGSISPISYKELNLSARGRFIQNNEESYGGYLNLNNKKFDGSPQNSHQTDKLENDDLYFYFENNYNSFLRNETSNIQLLEGYGGWTPSSIDNRYLFTRYIGTLNSDNFSNHISFNENYKKRTGNSITTYTNKQIRDSYESNIPIVGFVDVIQNKEANDISSEDFLDRSDTETFTDKGIGAYKVTAMDGKVYHYSLPVYNFESFYKHYHDAAKKNLNFFEISKMKPYATHWLLTAVTGPDYVDINNNGKLDNADYGYWVSFDYGKWSDGYLWQTPVEERLSNEKSDNKNYSIGWGRKQLYYLDAIKTRTHTAIFVKELREDNISSFKRSYGSTGHTWNPNRDFILETDAKEYVKDNTEIITNIELYKSDGSLYDVNDYLEGSDYCNKFILTGKRTKYDYLSIPETKSLKLKKIMILKNQELENLNLKNLGTSLTDKKTGYLSIINGYSNFSTSSTSFTCNRRGEVPSIELLGLENTILFDSKKKSTSFKVNKFESHFSENVIDVKDLDNLDFEEKSVQEILLVNDYSLVQNSPNSEANSKGRSTLKEVHFKGKGGIQVVPPYKFFYNNDYSYDKSYENDWGYRNHFPETWSLNKIVTPIGTNIDITYEKDEFETAINNYIIFKNESDRFEAVGPIINHTVFADPSTFYSSGNPIITIRQEEFSSAILKGERKSLDINIGDKLNIDYTGFILNERVNSVAKSYYLYQYEYKGLAEVVSRNGNSYDLNLEGEIEYTNEFYDINYKSLLNNLPQGFEENKTITNKYIFARNNTPNNARVTYKNELWYTLKVVKEIDYIRNSGGYRTKDISISNSSGNILKTTYDYNSPLTGETSGITSYAPFSIQTNVVPYVSELPPPLVIYKNITMRNYDGNNKLLGYTVYEFETLESMSKDSYCLFSLGDAFKVKENQNETLESEKIQVNKFTLYNKLANVGRLLSIKAYNTKNQLLSVTENNYKSNLDNNLEIGVSQESYKSLKAIYNNSNDSEIYLISSTSKINYPSVLESVTTTQGNFNVTKYFDEHDFLTGQVLETRTYASDGVAFKTKVVPAYFKYSAMGSKIDNENNANMLTQSAANYTYLYKDNDWQPVGVNISTWNNDWSYLDYTGDEQTSLEDNGPDIWRKHKNYVWKGDIDSDGIYTSFTGDEDNFKWGVGQVQTDTDWQQVSEVTKYDHYSMTVESKDINDNYVSTKMGDNNSKVIAVANAAYTEMFYSGAEYEILDNEGISSGYFDGAVKFSGTRMSKTETDIPHTGNFYLRTSHGQNAFEITIPERSNRNTVRKNKFKVSVWVKKGQELNVGIKINEGATQNFNQDETILAGDWSLLNGYVDITDSATSIAITSTNGTIDVDDFRVHPVTSSMTSYVYNEYDEVTFITGANGLSTCYVYDKAGRLVETWVEVKDLVDNSTEDEDKGGFKKVSTNSYSYKNQ